MEATANANLPDDGRPDFERVFEALAPFVWRLSRRLGVQPADVQDVCQEVFLVVHRRLPAFQGPASIKAWTLGICVKVVSAYHRRAHRRHEELRAQPTDVGSLPSQERQLSARRELQRLFDVLESMEDDKRQVFVLYELEECSVPQIAEAMGCPVTTVYSRLYAARDVVQAAFAREPLGRKPRS